GEKVVVVSSCANHSEHGKNPVDWNSSSVCTNHYSGESTKKIDENVEASENSFNRMVSIDSGLRLKNSPHPQYPVGSLLLVEKSNKNGDIHKIHVVQRSMTIFFNE